MLPIEGQAARIEFLRPSRRPTSTRVSTRTMSDNRSSTAGS